MTSCPKKVPTQPSPAWHAAEPVPQHEGGRSQLDRGKEGIRAALTHAEGFLLEVLGEVGAAGDAVHVTLQHVPTHLVIEGITKFIWDLQNRQEDLSGLLPTAALRWQMPHQVWPSVQHGSPTGPYPCAVLNAVDSELHRDVEAV